MLNLLNLTKFGNRFINNYTLFKQKLTPLAAIPKIKHYCSYQERSHKEVKDKLYSLGLNKLEVETMISTLIEEDYLNEERFAQQFVGGKFRLKQWGKIKIKYELKLKNVSDYNIKKGLTIISDDEYSATLLKLATAKWKLLKTEQYIHREIKITNYLMQKGYEPALIKTTIQLLKEKATK